MQRSSGAGSSGWPVSGQPDNELRLAFEAAQQPFTPRCLAVLRELAVLGKRVALVEKEEHLVAGAASSGNSGVGCTGYDAPAGSLERALLRRAIQRHPELMRTLGLSYQHVNKCGALVVARSPVEQPGLAEVVRANASAGDTEAHQISRHELLQREPSLAPDVEGAVVVPREVVVEPWLIPIAYAQAALAHGADIFTGEHVAGAERSGTGPEAVWVLRSSTGRSFRARTVINCAGLFGDELEQACLGKEAPFEIRPRKGQFLIFELGEEERPRHVIQPVPTQHSKGVFVWTTMWGTVVVGPTATDQSSKTDRAVDRETANMLWEYGSQVHQLGGGHATPRDITA
jgi:glycerol-3-phosphate dehydrogenase